MTWQDALGWIGVVAAAWAVLLLGIYFTVALIRWARKP